MKCPFCSKEMIKGVITGDGRTKVRWHAEGEEIGLIEAAFTEKGVINAKYSLAQFRIDSFCCDSCNKMIFETNVK